MGIFEARIFKRRNWFSALGMAIGRHGGCRDDEFRDRDSDRDSLFAKEMEENERGRNQDGDRHGDRDKENDRFRDSSRDYRPSRARHREKEHRDRNGVYASGYSSSSPHVHGDNNYSHGQASHNKDVDREPGELSSGSVFEILRTAVVALWLLIMDRDVTRG